MKATDIPGVIEPGRLYIAEEAMARLRLGSVSWRKLRQRGLPLVQHGNHRYVLGDDIIALFASMPDDKRGLP